MCTVFVGTCFSICVWSKSHVDKLSHLFGLQEKLFVFAFHLWQEEQGISDL